MKKFLIGSVVAVLCMGAPAVYADDTHQHGQGSAPESKSSSSAGDSSVADMQMGKAQESMKQAQALMAKLRETKDPAERRKLMQQHTQAMRDTMGMMREMKMGMMGCGQGKGMMSCGEGMGAMGGEQGMGMMGGEHKMGAMGGDHMMGMMSMHQMMEERMEMMQMMMEQMFERQEMLMQGGK